MRNEFFELRAFRFLIKRKLRRKILKVSFNHTMHICRTSLEIFLNKLDIIFRCYCNVFNIIYQ